jgi:hypothetical protein
MLQCGIALLWAAMLQVAGASLTGYLLPGVRPRVFSQTFSLPDQLGRAFGPGSFSSRRKPRTNCDKFRNSRKSLPFLWAYLLTPTVE